MENKENRILEIKDLVTSFNLSKSEASAIRGVSLYLEKDEVIGIGGESGSGKSLLMKSVLRILPQNAFIKQGQIIYKGKDLCLIKEKEMYKVRGNEFQ